MTSDKPVSLAEKRLEPDADVVEALRDLLAEAEAGRLRAAAWVILRAERLTVAGLGWRPGQGSGSVGRVMTMVGGVSMLSAELRRELWNHYADSPIKDPDDDGEDDSP